MSQATPAGPTSPVAPASNPQIAPPDNIDPRIELTLNEQLGHYVEMWKKSVDVQQHFNDIEWRIRGLALTVATFALGAAGVAAKDGTRIGWLSLGSLVVLLGLLLWYGFYFVDRVWYHPLLKSAVKHGTVIEEEIKKSLPQAGMTAAITAGSPQNVGRIVQFFSGRSRMHSDDKLIWFYKVGAAALFLAAVALQISAVLPKSPPVRDQIDVRIEGSPAGPTASARETPSSASLSPTSRMATPRPTGTSR